MTYPLRSDNHKTSCQSWKEGLLLESTSLLILGQASLVATPYRVARSTTLPIARLWPAKSRNLAIWIIPQHMGVKIIAPWGPLGGGSTCLTSVCTVVREVLVCQGVQFISVGPGRDVTPGDLITSHKSHPLFMRYQLSTSLGHDILPMTTGGPVHCHASPARPVGTPRASPSSHLLLISLPHGHGQEVGVAMDCR